eukprot:CAMPEP_0180396082 /NCGR_PEP_ID=MMETSP0989-20121125/35249_1 /TAXON_ID=697907 /ORGANISM="non described non described, Strain CCMP2293" /LENGTH=62 /DNA_ID=CAMNT_0022398321 /DNA_START=16 /DNA_END=201 /DNA_ORIENTATION=+
MGAKAPVGGGTTLRAGRTVDVRRGRVRRANESSSPPALMERLDEEGHGPSHRRTPSQERGLG